MVTTVCSGLYTCCPFGGVFLPLLSLISYTGTSSSTGQTGLATTSKYYDDIYFDSDSEDEDKTGKWLRRKENVFTVAHSLRSCAVLLWGQGAVPEGSLLQGITSLYHLNVVSATL